MSLFKQFAVKAFNLIGLEISKKSKSPKYTLLGLKTLPIKTIIDVGASTGRYFAKIVSRYFPNANIYCFEPLAEPFKQLKRWADKQNGKVEVFNLALGDKEEEIEIFNHLEHSASSSILKTTEICETLYPFTKKQTTKTVKMTTLDKAVASISKTLSSDILIKLDVQGYEDRVIKGGIKTFNKAKACLLEVSIDKLYENQTTFREVFFLLDELGYRYAGNLEQTYDNDGHVIFINAVFVNSDSKT